MIMKSHKTLPIGLILRKGVEEFTGHVFDFDGNLVECKACQIMKEETKEAFIKQFEKENKRIFESTLKDFNLPETKYYLISVD